MAKNGLKKLMAYKWLLYGQKSKLRIKDKFDSAGDSSKKKKLIVEICLFLMLTGSLVTLGNNFIYRENDTAISESYQNVEGQDEDPGNVLLDLSEKKRVKK